MKLAFWMMILDTTNNAMNKNNILHNKNKTLSLIMIVGWKM